MLNVRPVCNNIDTAKTENKKKKKRKVKHGIALVGKVIISQITWSTNMKQKTAHKITCLFMYCNRMIYVNQNKYNRWKHQHLTAYAQDFICTRRQNKALAMTSPKCINDEGSPVDWKPTVN